MGRTSRDWKLHEEDVGIPKITPRRHAQGKAWWREGETERERGRGFMRGAEGFTWRKRKFI